MRHEELHRPHEGQEWLARGFELKCASKVCHEDFKDPLISQLVEGMLQSYPPERDPSSYLLGDAVLVLNKLMADVLLGAANAKPVSEKARRSQALQEGTQLKMLLSYVRASSNRSERGRCEGVTYLKELALKGREKRKRLASSKASSGPAALRTLDHHRLFRCLYS